MTREDKLSSEVKEGQFLVGITGEMGCGKNFVSNLLVQASKFIFDTLTLHHIDYDQIGHFVLSNSKGVIYEQARYDISNHFGSLLMNKDGSVNRSSLRNIVFNEQKELEVLNTIMKKPMLNRFYEVAKDKKGIILFNAATLVEHDLTYVVNNNVILVDIPRRTQKILLAQRDNLAPRDISELFKNQLSYSEKKLQLEREISSKGGVLWNYLNTYNSPREASTIETLLSDIVNRYTLRTYLDGIKFP